MLRTYTLGKIYLRGARGAVAKAMWLAPVALLALVGLGTSTGCAVRTRRAALVPHMVPSPRSGQPIRGGLGQIYLHHSAVTSLRNPREAPEANAGVYIPRYQIGGGMRFRIGRDFDMGLVMEYGLRQGSIAVAEDVPPRPSRDTFGIGLSFAYSIRATRRFRIGLTFDPFLYFIPKVEYPATSCNPPDWVGCVPSDKDTEVVPVLSFSVIPSVLVNRWLVLFGGITVRNHPTIEKEGWDTPWDDQDVEMGPANVTLGVGAEFRVHKRVFFMLQLYYPVTRDPVVYYPVVGAGFQVSFGREYQPPPKVQPQPPVMPPSQGPPPALPPHPNAPRANPPGTTPAPPPPPPPDSSTPASAPSLPPDAEPPK